MDMLFEFLIPRRPLSVQAKHKNRQTWKQFVRAEAAKTWVGQAPFTGDLHLTLVYLFDTDPADIDNIIKPIQDALVGLVYSDDSLITDVEAHRRSLFGTFDLTRCPQELLMGIASGKDCVYVRVSQAKALEDYL
jgi:hypothetical protein